MPRGTRFEALSLAGITRDHDDHSGAAPMRSTGAIVQMSGDERRLKAKAWGIEYKCDVCGAIVVQMNTEYLDLVREVLHANGIAAV